MGEGERNCMGPVRRSVPAPLVLLAFTVGAYALVLLGAVPSGYEAPTILAGILAVAALAAFAIDARWPALTAAAAAVGFALTTASPLAVVRLGGTETTIGMALAVVGGLGFLATTLHLAWTRATAVRIESAA